MPLIAFSLLELSSWGIILQVAIGLGMVIFVHELGHFAVAKACGVKCEKFFLGFDIYGLKLFSKRWGETEYGIGILPLGGYVKMLGQDDNPSKAAEERERSHTGAGEGLDPRSYMAKSVPQRMAIISAGVIMNVIFAFVLASIAYSLGVKELRPVVGALFAGEAAWRGGLQTGDVIREINGQPITRYNDLLSSVVLSAEAVDFTIDRPGVKEPVKVRIITDNTLGRPTIGIGNSPIMKLGEPTVFPRWNKPLADELKEGDRVVAVDGLPVENYAQWIAVVDRQPASTLKVDIERTHEAKDKQEPEKQRLTVSVPPRPMLGVGITMEIGPVAALRTGEPAEKAGVEVGDLIVEIDGQAVGDPLSLPQRMTAKVGKEIQLKLKRDGKPIEITVKSQDRVLNDDQVREKDPLALPTLGLAYDVTTRIAAVDSSLADKLKPGDEIRSVTVKAGKEIDGEGKEQNVKAADVDLKNSASWPALISKLQDRSPGTELELVLDGDRKVTVATAPQADLFNFDRGLIFQADTYTRTSTSIGDNLALSLRETKEAVGQVYGFLRQLFTGRVSPKNLGGPGTIAAIAGASASIGPSAFLRFLAMLSANLAVLNFLPIPLLDGGHMVFLIAEGIRGKPVSERVVVAFHYAGFAFIIGLMIFVISLDIQRFVG
jgi:regulator of sigma E protease